MRDLTILRIAGKFWVYPKGRVKVPLPGGKMYAIFDTIEEAATFRRNHS